MELFNSDHSHPMRRTRAKATIFSLAPLIAISLLATPLAYAQGTPAAPVAAASQQPAVSSTTSPSAPQTVAPPVEEMKKPVVAAAAAPAAAPTTAPAGEVVEEVVEKIDQVQNTPAPQAKPASDETEKKWYDYVQISPDLILRTVALINDPGGRKVYSDIFKLGLKANMDFGNLKIFTELDATQQKSRGFYPSNVILRTGYIKWLSPVKGLSLSGGLLFNQFGFFWDDSFYGNPTVYMGKKLDTDMNLEVAYNNKLGDHFGLDAWFQATLAGIDGVNPSIPFPGREVFLHTAYDFEADPLYNEGVGARFRVVPHLMFGKLKISPGFSLEVMSEVRKPKIVKGKDTTAVYPDKSKGRGARPAVKNAPMKAILGSSISTATELTLEFGPFKLISEFQTQRISANLDEYQKGQPINRYYASIAGVVPVFRRANSTWFRGMKVTAGMGYANYSSETLKEYIYNVGALFDIQEHLKAQVEYARYWNSFTGGTVNPKLAHFEGYNNPYLHEIVFLLVAKY